MLQIFRFFFCLVNIYDSLREILFYLQVNTEKPYFFLFLGICSLEPLLHLSLKFSPLPKL